MVVAKPTVLCLHGFSNTGACWAPVIERLPLSYRALAPDLRGHGGNAGREPVDLESVLGDLEALIPLEPDPFLLCGYSQGGRIALHLAIDRPDRVRRLVLIGASPGIADADERQERRVADELLASEIEGESIAQFAERWERTPVLAGLSPELAAIARTDRLRNDPRGLARALRGLGAGALPSLWDRLDELTMPVTLLVGEDDRKFAEIALAMAERIPAARVEIVPGAGHQVHLQRPDVVAAAIGAAFA